MPFLECDKHTHIDHAAENVGNLNALYDLQLYSNFTNKRQYQAINRPQTVHLQRQINVIYSNSQNLYVSTGIFPKNVRDPRSPDTAF
jgi:hypothetical protein